MSHVSHVTRLQPSQWAYVIDPDITPLLRLGVSTSQLCFVGVLEEKVPEQQHYISEILPRFPSVLLCRVSQPLHQVLHSLSHLFNIQDPLDLILHVVILNCSWWRGRVVLGREGWGMVWSQQQLIEDLVDAPGSRKLEPVSHRPHLLLNHEGARSLVIKLLGGPVHLQVLGVQPDQVPLGILMTWAVDRIVPPLH